jgi:hypothetical protein
MNVVDKSDFVEHSSRSEADSRPASREILRLLWKPMVHYLVHKIPPPVCILYCTDPSTIFHTIVLRSILTLSSHLLVGFQSSLFSSDFLKHKKGVRIAHISCACYMYRTCLSSRVESS